MFLALALALVLSPAETVWAPAEVFDLNSEMKLFVDQYVNSSAPELDRVYDLVNAIFDDDKLNFVYDRSRTKTAAETFQEQSGNCLSFSNLFIAMARYAGLDARFQEVDMPPTWDKHGQIVVNAQHVNVVVFIEGRPFEVDLAATVDRIRIGTRVVSDHRALAHYFSNKGVDSFGNGSPIRARENFKKAVRADPTCAFAWSNLAVSESTLGNLEVAEQAYQRSLELAPNRLGTLDNLVKLYEKMDRKADSSKLQKKVARYRRKNPFYHFLLGQRAFDRGAYEAAVHHFQQAVKRRSGDHSFHFQLAQALAHIGEMDKARKQLAKAEQAATQQEDQNRYSRKLELLAQRR